MYSVLTAHEDNTIAYHLLNTAYIESITLSDKNFNVIYSINED